MSGTKILIDTNIAISLFKGDSHLAAFLQNAEASVSVVNELELLSYQGISRIEEAWIAMFLDECMVIDINARIKEITIHIRRKYKLKLPDALIAATAVYLNVPLLSCDEHFERVKELVFILYET